MRPLSAARRNPKLGIFHKHKNQQVYELVSEVGEAVTRSKIELQLEDTAQDADWNLS